MTRREFAVGAVAAQCGGAAGRPAVCAHLWLYAARLPQFDPSPVIADVFRDLSKAGYDGVELMHGAVFNDETFAKIPELSAEFRLPVAGSSWSANTWKRDEHSRIVEDGDRLTERLGKLKARHLGMSVGDARRPKTPDEFDAQADILRRLTAMAAKRGLQLNLHNHVYEVANNEFDLRNTLERLPDAKLGPDLGWLFRAKIDPLDFLKRHRSRIVYMHLRNEKADGTWPEDLSEGVIDYAAIGEFLRSTRYTGDLAVELAHERGYTPLRSNQENFRISREWVRRTMKR